MTAPHRVFDFDDNTTHSDATSKANSTSPAYPAFRTPPITAGGKHRIASSSNQSSGFSSSSIQPGPLADQSAHPSNDLSFAPSFDSPSQLHLSPQLGDNADSDVADQTHPAFATNVSSKLTSFCQLWENPISPLPHSVQRAHHEPTGELINEHIDDFLQFDSPSSFRSIANGAKEDNSNHLSHHAKSIAPPQTDSGQPPPINAPVVPKSVLKRKSDQLNNGESGLTTDPKRPSLVKTRAVSFERMSAREAGSPSENQGRNSAGQTRAEPHNNARRGRPSMSNVPKPSIESDKGTTPGASTRPIRGSKHPSGHPPSILPPEKVFPIQIGSELFRLSGASISSDAPSYFTQFFEEQIRENAESGGVRTLYIDRDPITFRDVARHLQGYYVKPTDGSHFVKLFADAQFYSLPRLIDQLFESEIYIQIGERHFQIPKDLFSEPGNSPNFFSLGFAVFFSTPGEVFPGLDRRGLLRPPSITPPYVPNRSAEVFAEILHLLRGYPLQIRDDDHRQQLLRDCRYFHLRGLEQKIIAHEISYNLQRSRQEISLRLEDVKPSGISYRPSEGDEGIADEDSGEDEGAMATDDAKESENKTPRGPGGWVCYARPFVDEASYELVVEIGNESTQLDLKDMRADFHGLTKARVSSLLQVVANKMNLPTNAPWGLLVLGQGGGANAQGASPGHTPLSEDRVKVRFDHASAVTLDGAKWDIVWNSNLGRRMDFGQSSSTDRAAAEGDEMDNSDSDADEANDTRKSGAQQQSSLQRQHPQQRQSTSTKTPSTQVNPKQSTQQSQPLVASATAAASGKKRKRPRPDEQQGQEPTTGDLSQYLPSAQIPQQADENATWTIKTAQFRLRIQPCPQDRVRGGLEVIFVVVKMDAWQSENARNEQRSFLGG